MPKSPPKPFSLSLLEELTGASGAPGDESAVRLLMTRYLNPTETDSLGNTRWVKKGKGPRVLLSAHMDEVGFAVQSITSEGFIRLMPLGGWWSQTLLSQKMRVVVRDGPPIKGVIAAKPVHFLSEAERREPVQVNQMFLDVGARSRKEAMEDFGIRLGDTIVPDTTLEVLHNPDYLLAKAFDNRAGMAALIESALQLADSDLNCELQAVATVQEELGTRGALVTANHLDVDLAIVLEGAPADDLPGSVTDECQGALRKGPQIRIMDPTALMNRGLVRFAEGVARSRNIPVQLAVRNSGGTDAKAFHLAHKGLPTVVLSVPVRYIHSTHSLLYLPDYHHLVQLVVEMIRAIHPDSLASILDPA